MDGPPAQDLASLLELFVPILSAESVEGTLAAAARLAGELSGAPAAAAFLIQGEELGGEEWFPAADAVRARFGPHLRRLAGDSARRGTAVTAPFPPGLEDGGEPRVLLLADGGRTLGVLCVACPPAHGESCSRLGGLVAPVIARQLAVHRDAREQRATRARYERWFRQLDQHLRVLDRERQKFAAVAGQSDIFVLSVDPAGVVRWTNRAMVRQLDHDSPGWPGRPCGEAWKLFGAPTEDFCPVARAFETHQTARQEFRREDADGTHIFCATALPIFGPDGRAHEALVLVQDLTGLEVVRRVEQRLRHVVSNSPIVLFALDRDGVFTLSEGKALAALGLEPGQAVGQSVFDLYRDHPAIVADVRRALAGEEFSTTAEVGPLTFETRFSPLRDAAGDLAGTIGASTDISERRRLEGRLLHAHEMEVLGRLAGGVAHDFNDLLTVILGNAELMLSRVQPGHPLRHCAEEVQKAGAQGARLTRQLLAFSRRETAVAPQRLDLDAVVDEMGTMLRRVVGQDIEIETVRSSAPAPVRADRALLEQLLVNLALSSKGAMPRGGKLCLEVGAGVLPEREAGAGEGLPAGAYVSLTVLDTGCGMDEQTLAHVFEPFFGTEERGVGGLGLPLAYDIVRRSGGDMRIESRVGEGTTVVIRLPRDDAAGAAGEDELRAAA
ncbi:MAG: PAS domain-containing protein [Candidatus Eisenbacteria bacterium]|nr:PAS domain-containing protein [Candidatus Eisenbacteria bacterium]